MEEDAADSGAVHIVVDTTAVDNEAAGHDTAVDNVRKDCGPVNGSEEEDDMDNQPAVVEDPWERQAACEGLAYSCWRDGLCCCRHRRKAGQDDLATGDEATGSWAQHWAAPGRGCRSNAQV